MFDQSFCFSERCSLKQELRDHADPNIVRALGDLKQLRQNPAVLLFVVRDAFG